MNITDNITGLKLKIFSGIYKEPNKEIYRKSICIALFKKMILINLWKIKYE